MDNDQIQVLTRHTWTISGCCCSICLSLASFSHGQWSDTGVNKAYLDNIWMQLFHLPKLGQHITRKKRTMIRSSCSYLDNIRILLFHLPKLGQHITRKKGQWSDAAVHTWTISGYCCSICLNLASISQGKKGQWSDAAVHTWTISGYCCSYLDNIRM